MLSSWRSVAHALLFAVRSACCAACSTLRMLLNFLLSACPPGPHAVRRQGRQAGPGGGRQEGSRRAAGVQGSINRRRTGGQQGQGRGSWRRGDGQPAPAGQQLEGRIQEAAPSLLPLVLLRREGPSADARLQGGEGRWRWGGRRTDRGREGGNHAWKLEREV